VRADSDKIAKAREAMRQKMNEVQAQNPALMERPETTPAPAPRMTRPAPERPVLVEKPKPAPSAKVVKRKAPPAPKKPKTKVEPATNFEPLPDSAKVNEHPAPSVAATQTTPAAVQVTKPQPAPQAPRAVKRNQKTERKVSSSSTNRFPALEGPPSSFSASKQQKLDDLLRRYRADEVTPEQYHAERAKIVSEP
jgi:hypothetical protein